MEKEANIININKEDKEFIRTVIMLAPEKKTLVRGIIIGLQMQEETAENEAKNV